MKILLSEGQYINLQEKLKKVFSISDDQETKMKRYDYVANVIIGLMDKVGMVTIPPYRLMAEEGDKIFGQDMKSFLYKFLGQGEYDGYVKKLIKNKRPDEFTYTTKAKLGANNFLVEDGLAVKSMGEVIVYNIFKMNGIQLEYENPNYNFPYLLKTDKLRVVYKNPDFHYGSADEGVFIEVAGLPESNNISKDYGIKLLSSKNEILKTDNDIVILDYYKYKDDKQGFHKYVCETFNFEYKPEDFRKVIEYKGFDKDEVRKEIEKLANTKNKKRGEQDRLQKLIKQVDTKFVKDDEGQRYEPYKDVWDLRRNTGIGLKWGNKEFVKKVQKAWCNCSGSNLKTMSKFKELYPNETLGKSTIEGIKKKNPDEFDMNKRDEICNNI